MAIRFTFPLFYLFALSSFLVINGASCREFFVSSVTAAVLLLPPLFAGDSFHAVHKFVLFQLLSVPFNFSRLICP
ncbi:hypothetical protein KCP74_18295 [Salmonella enterica subsp. enterica]|nr:hypothetical protein KCP74_18295 [Salmonella enterica subsp. enterica]